MDLPSDITRRVLLFDGDTCSLLQESGLVLEGECSELLNIIRPMDVLDLHESYLDAGADILTANTFGANTFRLAQYGLTRKMEELVQSGIALCREAGGNRSRGIYVAASVGPTGEEYTHDITTPALIYKAFFSQCAAASAAGADLIYINTMSDLCEARLAILAARAATKLPILVSFVLEGDGHTPAHNPPDVLSLTCAKLGAAMAGLNCGYGPLELLPGYRALKQLGAPPCFIRPDAGDLRKSETPLTPDEMARAMLPYLMAGAAAIGGCCKASPAHIRAMRGLIGQFSGSRAPTLSDNTSIVAGGSICAPGCALPLASLEPYTTVELPGQSVETAAATIAAAARPGRALHIDFGDWGAEAIDALLFFSLPRVTQTPLAFHVHNARQANAALLAYPGIAAIYAHSDAYRVLRAAVRYGAEVIS
ncbi:MAG: homocysteine S-methyltransferase family protein [Clostridiales bacterium]|jgi:5-methyltetrahydrofolate--homocysteine methyltransferase|nr:homocysteine S-methyltransferase family protein [Clostridiales bacterium]